MISFNVVNTPSKTERIIKGQVGRRKDKQNQTSLRYARVHLRYNGFPLAFWNAY